MSAYAFLDAIDNGEPYISEENDARSSVASESAVFPQCNMPVRPRRSDFGSMGGPTTAKYCPGCELPMGGGSLTAFGFEDEIEEHMKIVTGRVNSCKMCYNVWR